MKDAAKQLLELDLSEIRGKKRLGNKARKREAKLRQSGALSDTMNISSSQESVGSEDTSFYLQDDELMEHTQDNYMSYLDEMANKDESSPPALVEYLPVEKIVRKKKKLVAKKNNSLTKLQIPKIVDQVDNNEIMEESASNESVMVIKNRKNKRDSLKKIQRNSLKGMSRQLNKAIKSDFVRKAIKSEFLNTSVSCTNLSTPALQNEAVQTPVQKVSSPKKFSPKTPNILSKSRADSLLNGTPKSSVKKRVSFILARNQEQGIALNILIFY